MKRRTKAIRATAFVQTFVIREILHPFDLSPKTDHETCRIIANGISFAWRHANNLNIELDRGA